MIKNAVTSTRQQLLLANNNLYTDLLNEYDNHDGSFRHYLIDNVGGGGVSKEPSSDMSTVKPTVKPTPKPTSLPTDTIITVPSDVSTDISTDEPTVKPTVKPIRPIIPFPEIAIGYIINDNPKVDWDIFNSYDIPDSNQYVEYDSYTGAFTKFDKIENATAYWTDFLQDKTVVDNSIIRLEQKQSNKLWNFYTYNIDNSYISRLFDDMYASFTNVRRFNEKSQNIINSFDQYTEKTDLVCFEFEGLSEFGENIITVNGNENLPYTTGKIKINVKHKKLKNIDYYVTATNGVHVDYNGNIYFPSLETSYVTAYLSADTSIYKTVAVKPSHVSYILGQQDITVNEGETPSAYACLKCYNANRNLPLISNLVTNNIIDFNEVYSESIILYDSKWNLDKKTKLYADIEYNISGRFVKCTEPKPVVRSDDFRIVGQVYQSKLFISGNVDIIDSKHIKLNLSSLDITARQLESSKSYRVTIYAYEKTKDNNNNTIDGVKQQDIKSTFNLHLSYKRLFPTGSFRPKIKLYDPLEFSLNDEFTTPIEKPNKTIKVNGNDVVYVKISGSSEKLTSISIEPANGNACSIVPKVERLNENIFKIYSFGKGSYKINCSVQYNNQSGNYIETDSYSMIINDDTKINKTNANISQIKTIIIPDNTDDSTTIKQFGYKITIPLTSDDVKFMPPASVIGQFNTFCDEARTITGKFSGEANIDYIYTDYTYNNDNTITATVWYYGDKDFNMVAPLRVYFVNVDNSIYYIDCKDTESSQSFAKRRMSARMMFIGIIDDFTDYSKDLNQELYAISKQKKISGFVKISLGLSDKPWTQQFVKVQPRPVLDPWIIDLQNKYVAKFTPKQISYLTALNKKITVTSDKNEAISKYLTSQKLEPLNTSSVLEVKGQKDLNLSRLTYINNQTQIKDTDLFATPALGLSKISEDKDVITPWNVSPQITIDNPTIWYDLHEYFGKIRRGCMYSTTEKNYDLNISKNTNFDTDMESVGITVNISKTDKIKIEFNFEMITAMIKGKKEEVYCIDKNSLKIAGTLDGKRLMLKYFNGCAWDKTTGKVTIFDNKSFNLVFGIINSRKRINLTFVVDEYYQVLDDLIVEDYDAPCNSGKKFENINGSSIISAYTAIKSIDSSEKIKSALQTSKYSYTHVWVDKSIVTDHTKVDRSYYNLLTKTANNSQSVSRSINETHDTENNNEPVNLANNDDVNLVFGTFALRKNNLTFEINYELPKTTLDDIEKKPLVYPPLLTERYISDDNIKYLIKDGRSLNLLEDHDYNICLNIEHNCDKNDSDKYTHLNTDKYTVRILCKNKLITIKSNISKNEPFEFNYKRYFDKYGYITCLVIFNANDKLVRTYMLNTSFLPYTKASIILERIHQTPIYYFNDALSDYKENGDYDNLLPSFAFYRDKQNQSLSQDDIVDNIEDIVNKSFSKFGLISGITAINTELQDRLNNIVPKLSLAVVDNKVPALQRINDDNVTKTENAKPVLVKDENDNIICKYKPIDLTNKFIIRGKDRTYQPNSMKYIGYLMYYYNMLYLRNLGWTMNADNDSEDMIYYMILLDKLKNTSGTFAEFRKGLFNSGTDAKYGNQIDIYETIASNAVRWKTTVGYIEYFKKYYNNIVKYWEDRIDAYNILEAVLGEYDSRLTVVEQIDKYLDYLGDDGTKRQKIYFILTTPNHQDKWLVSQINNRIYQQDAFYYIWSNVYQILFEGIFDFDLINDGIITDIYNYGLYPEIEIPEMTEEGLFKPYRINRYGKIEESKVLSSGEWVWDGSGDEKYKYILDENNFIKGIVADIPIDSEIKDTIWKATNTENDSLWKGCYIDENDKDESGWGTLRNGDGKECVLNIKGKIKERKKSSSIKIKHKIDTIEKTGLNGEKIKYITISRKINKENNKQIVHATYFGDCKEYWLDEDKCNIIKTNKRSLITGIRLQRFLCELFISELNKSMAMINVIQKFFEINDVLAKLRTDWRNILSEKYKLKDDKTGKDVEDADFIREIKYPLYDFNLKNFRFERNCIYPEDEVLYGLLTYSFDYYSWYDHKILSDVNSDILSINIPKTNVMKQLVHEQQIYDDFLTLNVNIPQNTVVKRKGISNTYISYNFMTTIDDEHVAYYVRVKPDESLGIESFGIYPWNINKDASIVIDSPNNSGYIYQPSIWSSTVSDLSGLPNYGNYDSLSRYIDIDANGKLNSQIIMTKVKSGELENAPAVELCYNFIPEEYINFKNGNTIATTISAYIFTYQQNYHEGFVYHKDYSNYREWGFFEFEKRPVENTKEILKNSLNIETSYLTNDFTNVINIVEADKQKFPFTYVSKTLKPDKGVDKGNNNSMSMNELSSIYTYTYMYGYILPDISYEVNAYYRVSNVSYSNIYYNNLHIKTKEETVLGWDEANENSTPDNALGLLTCTINDESFFFNKPTSTTTESFENTAEPVAATTESSENTTEPADAASLSSEISPVANIQQTTKQLSFCVSNINDLTIFDDGLGNGNTNNDRTNNRFTEVEIIDRIIDRIDDGGITTFEPVPTTTIPPIITKPIPTVGPFPTPTPTTIIPTDVPIETTFEYFSENNNNDSVFLEYSEIYQISFTKNGEKEGDPIKRSVIFGNRITTKVVNEYINKVCPTIKEENYTFQQMVDLLKPLFEKHALFYINTYLTDNIKFYPCKVSIKRVRPLYNVNIKNDVNDAGKNNYSFYTTVDVSNVDYFYKRLYIDNNIKFVSKKEPIANEVRKKFGFFLGSVSQWQIVQDNVLRINQCLKEIDINLNGVDKNGKITNRKYPEPDYFYEGKYEDNKYSNRLFWTSSEIDKDEAWTMFFDQYYCGLNNKMTSAYVRPFIDTRSTVTIETTVEPNNVEQDTGESDTGEPDSGESDTE